MTLASIDSPENHSGSKLLNSVVFLPQQVIFSLVVKIVGFDFLVIIMQTKFYKDIELSLSSHGFQDILIHSVDEMLSSLSVDQIFEMKFRAMK